MSNVITKRVSMYVRIKPEFKKDFDFEQIVIRIGYTHNPDPDAYSRVNVVEDLVNNIRIFLTETNGTPRNKELQFSVEEVNKFMDHVRNGMFAYCDHDNPTLAQEGWIEDYADTLPEHMRLMHYALKVSSKLNLLRAINRPVNNIEKYCGFYIDPERTKSIFFGEIKFILNKIVSMVLNKPQREVDAATIELPDCFYSIKRKYSDFRHEVYVDATMVPEVEDKDQSEVIAELLLSALSKTRKTFATCKTNSPYSLVKSFLDELSTARREMDTDKYPDMEPILKSVLKIERELSRIDQMSNRNDIIISMQDALRVLFGPIGDDLETNLKLYLNEKNA